MPAIDTQPTEVTDNRTEQEFQHQVRQYFIRCAKDALRVCPLPDFVTALDIFQWYDDKPSDRSAKALKRVYKRLKTTDYGAGPAGTFAYGLRTVMGAALYRSEECYSSTTVYFALVFEKAGDSLGLFNFPGPGVGDQARTEAFRRYHEIWNEVFGVKEAQ